MPARAGAAGGRGGVAPPTAFKPLSQPRALPPPDTPRRPPLQSPPCHPSRSRLQHSLPPAAIQAIVQRGAARRQRNPSVPAPACAAAPAAVPCEALQEAAHLKQQKLCRRQTQHPESRAGEPWRAGAVNCCLLLATALLLLLARLGAWQLACVCAAAALWLPDRQRTRLQRVTAPLYAGGAGYLFLAAGEPRARARGPVRWRGSMRVQSAVCGAVWHPPTGASPAPAPPLQATLDPTGMR